LSKEEKGKTVLKKGGAMTHPCRTRGFVSLWKREKLVDFRVKLGKSPLRKGRKGRLFEVGKKKKRRR